MLQSMPARFAESDPYIKQVRAGRFKPGVVRLVFDLKTAVKPQVFPLEPVGEYGHRLVLDLYPLKPRDPLLALVQPAATRSEMARRAVKPARPQASGRNAAAPLEKRDAGEARRPGKPKRKPGKPRRAGRDAHGHHRDRPRPRRRGPGRRRPRRQLEKNVTLAIARRLKEQDRRRAQHARGADPRRRLFRSAAAARAEGAARAGRPVRLDACRRLRQADARGSSVFALSERGAIGSAARWLAKKENEADLIGGVNLDVKDRVLARTLLDLSQTATINDSLKLGKAVLGEMGDINTLHKAAVEQAGFAVLKAPDIPSILVETAFISNPGGGEAPQRRRLPGQDGRRHPARHQALLRARTRRWPNPSSRASIEVSARRRTGMSPAAFAGIPAARLKSITRMQIFRGIPREAAQSVCADHRQFRRRAPRPPGVARRAAGARARRGAAGGGDDLRAASAGVLRPGFAPLRG